MELNVWLNQTVAVVKNGIINCNNVNVQEDLIGMGAPVFNVWMVKTGIKLKRDVNVKTELNGMDNFV